MGCLYEELEREEAEGSGSGVEEIKNSCRGSQRLCKEYRNRFDPLHETTAASVFLLHRFEV